MIFPPVFIPPSGGDAVTGTVALTTSIATRQAYQRGTSTVVLAGTYSLSGPPVGFQWRVGSGAWVAFTSETIGGGTWQGTMAIPANYLAQGALQIRPTNGPAVTPASVANITVSDIFVISGQSNASGKATNAQSFATGDFWPVVNKGAGYTDATGTDWPTGTGSCWPRLAALLDAAGIPPVFRIGAIADGTGFKDDEWTVDSILQEQVISRLNADPCGGFAGFLWDQGEADIDAVYDTADYKTDFLATLVNWRAEISKMATVPVFMALLGENSDAANVGRIRQAQLELIAENALIKYGVNLINEDYFDGAHYGTGSNDDQVTRRGNGWFRAIANALGYSGATDPAYGSVIQSAVVGTGADAAKITITFDRAVTNHVDETGWSVTDDGGATVASAAQGASTSIVVLTCNQALYGAVTVSWGAGNDAVGAALVDAGSLIGLPPLYDVDHAATGTGVGAAPVNTVIPAITGNAVVGSTLTASTGTWTAVPAASYAYQWKQDGSDISGATASTYVVQVGDVGHSITVTVTATNAVGSASATSNPTATVTSSETVVLNYITDGTSTNMVATNGSFTTAQPDSDGGNNAILFTCANTGTAAQCGANFANKVLYNGVNIVRFKVKINAWASAQRWLRPRFQNITKSNAFTSIDMDNHVIGTSGADFTNETLTDLGGGWWQFYGEADLTGADVTGNFYIYMGDADSDQNVVAAGDHSYFLYDLKISHL